MLIALSGYGQVGKDTVGEILVRRYGFKRVAFADSLKALALKADPLISTDAPYVNMSSRSRLSEAVADVGWEQAKKSPEVRAFLQRLGVACRETFGESIWIDTLAEVLLKVEGDIVLTDTRFPNEAQWAKANKGQVWRIERPGFTAVNGHQSETALDDWAFDETIVNDGSLQDLERKVVDLYQSLIPS